MSNWNKEEERERERVWLQALQRIADAGSEVSGLLTREIIMQMNNVAVADGNAI